MSMCLASVRSAEADAGISALGGKRWCCSGISVTRLRFPIKFLCLSLLKITLWSRTIKGVRVCAEERYVIRCFPFRSEGPLLVVADGTTRRGASSYRPHDCPSKERRIQMTKRRLPSLQISAKHDGFDRARGSVGNVFGKNAL